MAGGESAKFDKEGVAGKSEHLVEQEGHGLLEVAGVRLYHDQALFKEAGGGHTPWHADQFYWPLATDRTVTAWVPLVDVPMEMGPLAFATGSGSGPELPMHVVQP